jgi:hypothetical protein
LLAQYIDRNDNMNGIDVDVDVDVDVVVVALLPPELPLPREEGR